MPACVCGEDVLLSAVGKRRQIVAQPVPQPGDDSGSVFVLADRMQIRRLQTAKEYLQAEEPKYDQAVELLQLVLNDNEDRFFYPDAEDRTRFRSLKAEANRLLGEMPEEGLRKYRLQFSADANEILKEAVAKNDIARIAELTRRFLHTSEGMEGAYRLGAWHMNQSEPLAAALWFDRMHSLSNEAKKWEPHLSLRRAASWYRAGFEVKARDALLDLKTSQRDETTIRVGGFDYELFDQESNAIDWLKKTLDMIAGSGLAGENDWVTFRLTPTRNAILKPAVETVSTKWTQATLATDQLELWNERADSSAIQQELPAILNRLKAQHGKSQAPLPLPAPQPFVVGDTVFTRTLATVKAFDLMTGKPKWESICDQALFELLLSPHGDGIGANRQALLSRLLNDRLWSDANYAHLSSDGELLFAVDHSGMTTTSLPHDENFHSRDTNILSAFDLKQGTLQTQMGGKPGITLASIPVELPVAGRFFLSSPLALGGEYFTLTEVRGELRLMSFRLKSGEPEITWDQPLVAPQFKIDSHDPIRRLSGVMISYADGILVCPTDAGAVVALDASNRTLLWGYDLTAKNGNQPNPPVLPRPPVPFPPPNPRPTVSWADPVATLVDGKAMLTSRYSNQLHCIGLMDGKLNWKAPRGDSRYVLGCVDGRVLLLGASGVRALKMEDGKPVWDVKVGVEKIAGRGFIMDGKAYVPKTNSEIAVIDIAKGELINNLPMPAGSPPGNIISTRGLILSQTVDQLSVFPLPKE